MQKKVLRIAVEEAQIIEDCFPNSIHPREYKAVALRECPTPRRIQKIDTPEQVVWYWQNHIASHPRFNPETESFYGLFLDAQHQLKGHYLISCGLLDTVPYHARETFRVAIVSAAAALLLAHNHPSGNPEPSEGDCIATREICEAGRLLRIPVLDHVIIGAGSWTSMRSLNSLPFGGRKLGDSLNGGRVL